MVTLLQIHLIPLGATSRKASSRTFAGLYRPVLLLVFLCAFVLILRCVLLCPFAVIPSALKEGLVGLLRLLTLDILQLPRLGWGIADGVVALLQVLIVAIDDAAAPLLGANVGTCVLNRLAVLLRVDTQRGHHVCGTSVSALRADGSGSLWRQLASLQ